MTHVVLNAAIDLLSVTGLVVDRQPPLALQHTERCVVVVDDGDDGDDGGYDECITAVADNEDENSYNKDSDNSNGDRCGLKGKVISLCLSVCLPSSLSHFPLPQLSWLYLS